MRDRRKMNDYHRRVLGTEPSRLTGFICECGAENCHRAVLLRADEYDALRRSGKAVVIERPRPAAGSDS